jgi:hypothetical protein
VSSAEHFVRHHRQQTDRGIPFLSGGSASPLRALDPPGAVPMLVAITERRQSVRFLVGSTFPDGSIESATV